MLELERRNYVEMPRNSLQSSGPVDFAQYLLSASPPGVEFLTLTSMREKFSVPTTHIKTCANAPDMAPKFSDDSLDVTENNLSNNCAGFTNGSASKSKLNGLGKKTVSFADDLGYDLVTVKIMHESSDTPPWLSPETIRRLTGGAEPKVSESKETSLVLNFAQPAADYQVFREKLDRNKISLENVILKGNTITGTAKVVNIAFHKHVTVRYTCDKWTTFTDVHASYVPTGRHGQSDKYDTFSFEFEIPVDALDASSSVFFCICYDVEGQQFWDNNDDRNYEILLQEIKKTQSQLNGLSLSTFQDSGRAWSEFSAWTGVDTSVPYW